MLVLPMYWFGSYFGNGDRKPLPEPKIINGFVFASKKTLSVPWTVCLSTLFLCSSSFPLSLPPSPPYTHTRNLETIITTRRLLMFQCIAATNVSPLRKRGLGKASCWRCNQASSCGVLYLELSKGIRWRSCSECTQYCSLVCACGLFAPGKLLPGSKEVVADALPNHVLFGWWSSPVHPWPSPWRRVWLTLHGYSQ